jgi:hypothetical protein
MSRKKIHRGIAASLVVCRTITMLDYNADEFFLDNFEMGEELNENFWDLLRFTIENLCKKKFDSTET